MILKPKISQLEKNVMYKYVIMIRISKISEN